MVLISMLNTFEKKVIAEVLKQAKCINSKTEFAKIVYYLISERGIKLDLNYSQDFSQGSYSIQFSDILQELISNKLATVEEHKTPTKQRFSYCASESLANEEIELDEKIKLKISSILREYKKLGYKKIVEYDHEIYKDKTKTRIDKQIKEIRKELDNYYLSKSGGEEEKESELILSNLKQKSAPSWLNEKTTL